MVKKVFTSGTICYDFTGSGISLKAVKAERKSEGKIEWEFQMIPSWCPYPKGRALTEKDGLMVTVTDG